MDRRWWWLGAGLGAVVVALQVRPCTEGTAGCSGEGLRADGVEWCEDWIGTYAVRPIDSGRAIAIDTVEVGSVVAQLSSPSMTRTRDRRAGSGEAIGTASDPVARMKAEAVSYANREVRAVELTLDLGDLPFPHLERLGAMEPQTRGRLLAEHKARIEREQRDLRAFLDQLGAATTNPIGLVNHVHTWVAPEHVPEVVEHPDVKAVYPAWQAVTLLYDHEELRRQTFLSEYWDLGFKGESASRSCEPSAGFEDIKIAIIEPAFDYLVFPNRINNSHPGWRDCEVESCESRVRSELGCFFVEAGADPCQPPDGEWNAFANHGTWVASIAAGDITQGQDIKVSDVGDRLGRSGVAPEASILYFTVETTGFVAQAVEQAFLMGADVINLSLAVTECARDAEANCGGLSSVIRAVTRGGALVVAAAGNDNDSANPICIPGPHCSVCYPAVRPGVVSVGSVDTAGGVDYDLAEIDELSSRGPLRVYVGGRYASHFPDGVEVPAVSVAAPGTICGYFGHEDKYGMQELSGTSFAAPVVSGAAGLIREEFAPELWDARMLRSHLLALGDGSGVEQSAPGVVVGMSTVWGSGRLKFHPFETMRGPKGIAHRSFRLQEGDMAVLGAADIGGEAFDAAVTQWKMGLYADWSDLSAIPYLLITYWDVCDEPTMIAADLEAGLERHAVLESPAVDHACLEVRVYGYSVPSGGVEVFVTDYYHSGDPSQH